jgi:predicted dehydrogenase
VSELEPVRLGIIGCGSVSQAYNELIRPLRLDGEVAVTMACDIDPDQRLLDGTTRLDRIHRLWPGTGFTRDPAELISSDDVDAVLVLTSIPSHFELAYAALEAGKHVLVEKPMATTLDEGRRLLELSRSAPGLLVCAPHIVLSPTYRALWRHVRDGDIGRVLLARARYGHGGHGLPPWFFQRGGGALFDLGVYNVVALTGLLGPARRVTAFAGTAIRERPSANGAVAVEAIDNAHVLIDFGESVFASVTTGFTMQKYRSPAIELYGSGGTLQMLGDDWAPAGYELWRNEVGAWQVFEDEDPRWYWMDGLPHMVRCIRDGTRPLNTPDHAYHALEIMLAAERSAADGRAHEIESDLPPLDLSSPDAEVVRYESHDRSVPRQ